MEQKKIQFNLKTVTAVLCALVALFSFIAFATSKPDAAIKQTNAQIEQTESSITSEENRIAELQQENATYQQNLADLEAKIPELTDAVKNAEDQVTTATTAYNQAETALDAVCRRSYYSSYFCSADCRALHNNVTTKKSALDAAKSQVNSCQQALADNDYQIQNLKESIEYNEGLITDCNANIANLKAHLSELKGELVGNWFGLIFNILGILLAVGGLGLFAKILFCGDQDKKLQLIACGGIGGSALVFFIATAIESVIWKVSPILYILLNPHTYTMLIMAMFALVILGKTQKPVVCRYVAVVAAALIIPVSAAIASFFVGPLFAATMICLAFVIIPLVFTEYINIAKHIFLSFITFGIWQLVWTYHVTKNLNKVNGVVARTPRNELLLCMFLPLFYPYWLFKTAEYVEGYAQEKSKNINLETLAIVFAFFCPLFATVLIQNKINVVVGKDA